MRNQRTYDDGTRQPSAEFLSLEEQRWVASKWREIREAQTAADRANLEWKDINTSINHLLDRQGVTDIVQRTKIKGESIPLKDALATGNWHARNAERHIADLNLFLKMKEMGLL